MLGRSELFLVLAVSREEGLAYLVDLERDSGYVDSVSFDRLVRADLTGASQMGAGTSKLPD
jgi:hypothetical protein